MKKADLTSFPVTLAISVLICLPVYSAVLDREQFANGPSNRRETRGTGVFDSPLLGTLPEIDIKLVDSPSVSSQSDSKVKNDPIHVVAHSGNEIGKIDHVLGKFKPISGLAGDGIHKYFTITGFTVPVAMVYSNEASVPMRIPGISTSADSARAFVQRLITQAFCDVYEQYGSAVGPTNALTSSSSPNHLSVETNYTPLECNVVLTGPAATGNNYHKSRHDELEIESLADVPGQRD
ncbi:hypothetical protein KIN20_012982 [Parelaphostrongylus tenuis]|uniref:Uncharacterized protein n=1 Tax=Parelaphostrongylus tenuis TaxID=148309 RepID=A0AAD5MU30_PARTN|nr:hypothetical protein KIN20_012982 [Parelaphostrongylus tenuis]